MMTLRERERERERCILRQHGPGMGLPQRQHVTPSARRLSFGLSWPFYLWYQKVINVHGIIIAQSACMNTVCVCVLYFSPARPLTVRLKSHDAISKPK